MNPAAAIWPGRLCSLAVMPSTLTEAGALAFSSICVRIAELIIACSKTKAASCRPIGQDAALWYGPVEPRSCGHDGPKEGRAVAIARASSRGDYSTAWRGRLDE